MIEITHDKHGITWVDSDVFPVGSTEANYLIGNVRPNYPMLAIYDVRQDSEVNDTFVSLIRMTLR